MGELRQRQDCPKPNKPVLDPCCGSKMFYFDRSDPRVDFRDNNPRNSVLCDGRILTVDPDTIGDAAEIDAPAYSYHLVVFDPPHLTSGNGWQVEKYGKLPPDWREWMTRAFSECWRVLAPNGTLIFKWYEHRIKISEVLRCAPCAPLLGNRRPSNSKTHWLVFFKEGGHAR